VVFQSSELNYQEIPMAIKLSASWSKKIGLPAYSSVGASCQIECELETAALLQGNHDEFKSQVKSVYSLCREVVESELACHQLATPRNGAGPRLAPQTTPPNGQTGRERPNVAFHARVSPANVQLPCDRKADADVRTVNVGDETTDDLSGLAAGGIATDQGATQRQLVYLQDLARQIRGLGARRLETLAANQVGKFLDELTSREASCLIELLKDARDGRTSLQQILEEEGT
jgi:hypothetical protein